LNVAAAAAVAAARRGAEASDHVETNTSGGEFETFTWSGAKASASSLAAELAAPRPLALDRVYPVALEHSRTLILAIAIMLAAVFRLAGLSARGLAADETNKLRAIDAYHRLDFTANAEHPMLMKLTMLASTDVARGWNRLAAAAHLPVIAAEAALRFPNALAGAFTTVLIFWLVELMFDWPTAAFASLLWALDVNATAINRLGKEDTLLVFFLFLAMWCYERAKRVRTADPAAAARWHLRSGAAFGLSVAAKYMPHYLGMYFVFNAADDTYSAGTGPRFRKFFSAFGVAFLVANFALLIPSTWRYVLHYVEGDMLEHTGYQFAHHLYVNAMAASPWGVPPTFYFVYLATKVPVVVLLAMALGVIPLVSCFSACSSSCSCCRIRCLQASSSVTCSRSSPSSISSRRPGSCGPSNSSKGSGCRNGHERLRPGRLPCCCSEAPWRRSSRRRRSPRSTTMRSGPA
jgi:hypothetical protein